MRKRVAFPGVRFSIPTLKAAFAVYQEAVAELDSPDAVPPRIHVAVYSALTIRTDRGEDWTHDNVDEFFADYGRPFDNANIDFRAEVRSFQIFSLTVDVYLNAGDATVSISAPQRATIERIMRVFEDAAPTSLMPVPVVPIVTDGPRVFIGHGGTSQAWRLLKDHLADQHHYDVVAYETGARAGHTIRDVLEEMLGRSNFALLVMTAEDEQGDGTMRARQNVVHEAGLFQGKLGFPRAIILLEDGVENFSNLAGVQYIPFSRGNIRETFGDVLATLRREFGA